MSLFANGRLGRSPKRRALPLAEAARSHVTVPAMSDQNLLKSQMLREELASLFQILKKVAQAHLLNRLRARLMPVRLNANLANGRAGLSAAPLVVAARCHVIDLVTAQKVFQNRNARTMDSVRASLSKVFYFISSYF